MRGIDDWSAAPPAADEEDDDDADEATATAAAAAAAAAALWFQPSRRLGMLPATPTATDVGTDMDVAVGGAGGAEPCGGL